MDVSPGFTPKVDRESLLMPDLPNNPSGDQLGPVEKTQRPDVGVPPESGPNATVLRGSGSSANRRLAGSSVVYPIPMPLPGELVDTFLLEESIGVGGMGAVFRALDTRLDRHVALKLLPPDQSNDGEVVRRFYQEGRAAAQLDHENIARVFSIGQDGQYHYIAFEYIDGMSVRQRVEAVGPLEVAEAVDITLQIAYALVHASERGVVHRDIKPSNIVITVKGRAKLVDMGLARNFERGGDHGLTQTGMTLGSFDYISPEQARDPRDVDVRSDLYSLGCTIFHMLTGRPPFPGGTVLQKLIQHQEEPPPDITTLNPAVPAALAGAITRLLAKDRDRRYQSPEQLVRDLLAIAGSLNVAAPARESDAWTSAVAERTAADRHLVWLLPVTGVLVILGVLVWWGRMLTQPPGATLASDRVPSTQSIREPALPPPLGLQPASPPPADDLAATAGPSALYPRTIPVKSSEDLLAVITAAPRRSIIVLTDNGPYRIHGRSRSVRPTVGRSAGDLTIRADATTRPVIKLAEDSRLENEPAPALLEFSGGSVTLDGLEFMLDPVLPDLPCATIIAERTELTVRGCSFRTGSALRSRDLTAIEVRNSQPAQGTSERPPAVFVDSCHFDGSQTAIRCEGSAEIMLRDCTLAAGEPSIWFDNSRALAPVPADLRLAHTSIALANGPAIRCEGTLLRAWVDDSVIAASGNATGTLGLFDDPRNLTWRGRSNLYGGIGLYLGSSDKTERQQPVSDFVSWTEKSPQIREIGSVLATTSVWTSPDATRMASPESDNPTRAFLLEPNPAVTTDLGARRGPFGSLLGITRLAQRTGANGDAPVAGAAPRNIADNLPMRPPVGSLAKRDNAAATATTASRVASRIPVASAPSSPATVPNPADTLAAPSALAPMPPMSPMPVLQANDDEEPPPFRSTPPSPTANVDLAVPNPQPPATKAIARTDSSAPESRGDENLVRNVEQFQNIWRKIAKTGGSIRIAAGAQLDLPTLLIDGPGHYEIEAEPSPNDRRPRLRFRSSLPASGAGANWNGLFDLRSGTLSLTGIDLVIPESDALAGSRLAAVGLRPGVSLTMSQCTVSMLAERATAAAFLLPAINRANGLGGSDKTLLGAASISIRQCFVRSGGDGVFVAQGRHLDLQLADVLVATDGSLIHALGAPRPNDPPSPPQKIRIDRVTARLRGGLVHLESSADDRELPSTKIVADHSIFSTADRDLPLFRVDWRDDPGKLRTSILDYEGNTVVYHHINTYRQDDTAQTGVRPMVYNRSDWTNAFSPKDASPVLDVKVKFVNDVARPISAIKLEREDLRLAVGGPVPDVGCLPERVPEAPAGIDAGF